MTFTHLDSSTFDCSDDHTHSEPSVDAVKGSGGGALAIPSYLLVENWAHTILSGPFLGLDWGKKRCGIAISDPDNRVAMPIQVCQPGGSLRQNLVRLWRVYECRAMIIGWPLHSSGQPGNLCAGILRLAERLHHDHGWPIALWDERFTTQGARAWMCDSKTVMDDHAAAYILQGGLDRWHTLTQLNHTQNPDQ